MLSRARESKDSGSDIGSDDESKSKPRDHRRIAYGSQPSGGANAVPKCWRQHYLRYTADDFHRTQCRKCQRELCIFGENFWKIQKLGESLYEEFAEGHPDHPVNTVIRYRTYQHFGRILNVSPRAPWIPQCIIKGARKMFPALKGEGYSTALLDDSSEDEE